MAKQLSQLEQTMANSDVRNLASAMYASNKAGGMDQEITARSGDHEIKLTDALNQPYTYGKILERQVSELVKGKLKAVGQGELADLVSGNLQELSLLTNKIMENRTVADFVNEAERAGADVSALKQYRTNDNYLKTLEKLAKSEDPKEKEIARGLMALDTYVGLQYKQKLDQEAYRMYTASALNRIKAMNAPKDSELGKAYSELMEIQKTAEKSKKLEPRIPYIQKQLNAPTEYALAA